MIGMNYPKCLRYDLYSEGTSNTKRTGNKNGTPIVKNFLILRKIAQLNREFVEYKIVKKLKDAGINVITCRIPQFDEINSVSADEFYRNSVALFMPDRVKEGRLSNIEKLQFLKVYGYGVDEWNKMEYDEVQINYIQVSRNNYHSFTAKLAEKNVIYVIGPCIISGIYIPKNKNLLNCIQELADKNFHDKYIVAGIAESQTDFKNIEKDIEMLSIKEKDIVLIVNNYVCIKEKVKKFDFNVDIDLLEIYRKKPLEEEWFYDVPIHANATGTNVIAQEIWKKSLKSVLEKNELKENQKWIQYGEITSKELGEELEKYLKKISECKTKVKGKNGAIVMNCNPFTLGHQYLIEEALKQVDFLYIFVVEEDKSFFSFKDRYELVKSGTKNYKNVKVIPSGRFILSSTTFPEYFRKEEISDTIIDASKDILIFGRYISSELDIKVRFVGEEPMDYITNQYNRSLETYLTKFNVQFVEIPRKTYEGNKPISASTVRALLRKGDYQAIKEIVPETTYHFLLNKMEIT